jgi:hypothetical protein
MQAFVNGLGYPYPSGLRLYLTLGVKRSAGEPVNGKALPQQPWYAFLT